MKKIILLISTITLYLGISAQCNLSGTNWQTASAPTSGCVFATSTSNAFFNEFSTFTGLNAAQTYRVRAIFAGGTAPYTFNVYDSNVAGSAPIAFVSGTASPLFVDVPAGTSGTIRVKNFFNGCNDAANTNHTFSIECTSCAPATPAQPGVNTIAASSANITFTNASILEYGPPGFTPGTGATAGGGTVINPATSPTALTGLTPSTPYDVYVRLACGAGFSANSPVRSFTTLTPPPNDNCADAITLNSCVGGVQTTSGTTINSSVDALYTNCGAGGNNTTQRGVWYVYNGDDNEVTINTCGPGFDTRITVYSGTCGMLTCVTANDDMGAACAISGLRSEVSFNALSGTTYYIFVHGWQSGTNLSDVGNFVLNWTCAPLCAPVPSNEVCASAEVLTVQANATTTTAGFNSCASVASLNPACVSEFASFNDVWYEFEATSTNLDLVITFSAPTSLGAALYTGACGSASIGCIPPGDLVSGQDILLTGLTVGQTYRLQVYSTSAGVGSFDIVVWENPCPFPTALAVSNIAANTASVSWTENGTATAWDLYYGETPLVAPNDTTPPTESGVTINNLYALSGLNGLTQYSLYVRSVCNSAWFGPVTFTTLIEPPACGGDFYDHAGPTANYGPDRNDTTIICPDNAGDVVTVTFNSFSTDEGWHGLLIYNGDNVSAPLISSGSAFNRITCPNGAWTGSGAFAPSPSSPFISTDASGCLTFVFLSDDFGLDAGWEATVTCAPPPTCDFPTGLATTNITINSADLSWASAGTLFDVELGVSGFTPTGTPTEAGVANPFTVTGLSLLTAYDYYVRQDCGVDGFSAWVGPFSFTTQAGPPSCGGFYIDNGGITGNYLPNSNDTLVFCADNPDDYVVFDFTFFNVENGWDGLLVYNGNSTSSPLIPSGSAFNRATCPNGAWTGTGVFAPSAPFVSTDASGCLTFVFLSDGTDQFPGFVAEISCLARPAAITSISPSSNTYCVGDDVTLVANGVADDVQWFDDACGGNLVGTGNNFVVSPTTPSATYFARNVENGVFSLTCASVTITEGDKVTIALQPSDSTFICDGESLNLVLVNSTPVATVQNIVVFDFNNDDTTPIEGSGIFNLVGGTTNTYASATVNGGSSDPTAGTNRAINITGFPASGLNPKTAGAEILVNTTGFEDLTFSFDQRMSNTAANTYVVQYNLDVTDAGSPWVDAQTFSVEPQATGTGSTWFNQRSVDMSAIIGANDNPNLGLRIVSDFDSINGDYLAIASTSSYGTGGTVRFDMVTLSGTPINTFDILWSTNETSENITVSSSDVYSVVVSSSLYCSDELSVYVGVNPVQNNTFNISICDGDSFELASGLFVSIADTYVDTVQNSFGCDSIVTIVLDVLPTVTNTLNETICANETYTLPDGSTTNVADTYIFTLQGSNTCDSVVTVVLDVLPVVSGSAFETICANETFTLPDGTIVDTAGIYTVDYPNGSPNGCDSVYVVILDVLPLSSTTINASICANETYTLPDATVTNTPGTYSFTSPGANTCDSTYTVVLDVLPIFSSSQNASICANETYTLPDGSTTNVADTYVFTLPAANGCDSVHTVVLDVLPVATTLVNATICANETYTLPDGSTTNIADTYTFTSQAANGCDSIYAVVLGVLATASSTENVDLCFNETYTLPDGSTTNVADTYVYDYPNGAANGCDSTYTVTLNVLPEVVETVQVSVCEGTEYELPDGTIVTESDTFTFVFANASAQGCDSTLIVEFVVNDLPVLNVLPDITFEGSSVDVDAGAGFAVYDWSTGDTTQVVTIDESGAYSLTVTDFNGCSASASVNVTLISSIRNIALSGLKVYPVPANENLNLEFSTTEKTLNMKVVNVAGAIVYSSELNVVNGNVTKQINVSNFADGVYYIHINGSKDASTISFTVNR